MSKDKVSLNELLNQLDSIQLQIDRINKKIDLMLQELEFQLDFYMSRSKK